MVINGIIIIFLVRFVIILITDKIIIINNILKIF